MKVGVVGGGQLGRMLGLAGLPLGFQFRFLEPSNDAPSAHLGEIIRAAYDDSDGLERFARDLSCATYEFENIPAATAQWLDERLTLAPTARALAIAQDRVVEKATFRELGIPVQATASIASELDIPLALERVALPAVLKTRRLGYDGKGQRTLLADSGDSIACVRNAWNELGRVPCLLESFVTFSAEVSQIAVRGRTRSHSRAIAFYPLTQNEHRGGILWKSQTPAPCDPTGELAQSAQEYVTRLMESIDYIGVIAVEFFVTPSGLVANELAPRVHNSGHWTIDGAVTSQFENHLRAVAGLPLGSTDPRGASVMINLVGRVPIAARVFDVAHTHLHLYGKGSRAGRKLGHVTLTAPTALDLAEPVAAVEQLAAWQT